MPTPRPAGVTKKVHTLPRDSYIVVLLGGLRLNLFRRGGGYGTRVSKEAQ